MRSVEFLDAVRAKHAIPSDVQLAKFLRMDHSRVSLYRTGRRTLDPEACIKVAAALELPAEYVLASVQAERAKRSEHRRLWERLAALARASVLSLSGVAIAAGELSRGVVCIFCQIAHGGRSRGCYAGRP